jgi:hypothetical protein
MQRDSPFGTIVAIRTSLYNGMVTHHKNASALYTVIPIYALRLP